MNVSVMPRSQHGCDVFRFVNLLNTGQVVKANNGVVFGYILYNAATAVRFVKLYNKATAPASTDTPLVTIAIPASGVVQVEFVTGIQCNVGIGVRACTGLADSDNTAPTANDVTVNILYK
jgi:hypothetical protein